jgi:hypothetical protein
MAKTCAKDMLQVKTFPSKTSRLELQLLEDEKLQITLMTP